jgi:bis(5'-adenosyl)-triphosphatase
MMTTKHKVTCPFCDESVTASAFFTRGDFLALYNIAPVLPGHSLIIPKNHYTGLLELNDKELLDFFITAKMALRILLKAFNTDSFDWSLQEKPEAGQTIEHLHLHIVPRLKGDLKHPGDWYPLLQHNDDVIIDSLSRPRIQPEVMAKIIADLKRVTLDPGQAI